MFIQLLMPVFFLPAAFAGQKTPSELAEKLPLVDRLPAETTHYVFRSGGESFSEKVRGKPAGDVLAEGEMQELLKSFEGLMTKSKNKELRKAWRLLMASCHGDVVSAHISVGDGGSQVLTVVLPRTPAETEAMKKALTAQASFMFKELEPNTKELPNGVIYGNPKDDRRTHLGWLDDRCFLYRGAKARDVLLGPAPKNSLADSEPFQKAVGALKLEKPVGFYYYHLQPLWKDAARDDDDLSRRLDASGLTSLMAIAGGASVHGGRYHNEHFWLTDDRQGGLFKYVRNNSIPAQWLKLIPQEAVSFTYGTLDSQAFMNLLFWSPTKDDDREKGKPEGGQKSERNNKTPARLPADKDKRTSSSEPADPAGAGNPAVSEIFGVEIDPQLISSMGTRYLIYRAPTAGRASNPMYVMMPPMLFLPPDQIVILFELKDEAAFKKAFDAFWKGAKERTAKNPDDRKFMIFWDMTTLLRELDYHGETIYEVNFYLPAYFHIGSGRVAVSMNPELLKNYIRHRPEDDPSLCDTAEFKEVIAKVPKNACFLAYMHKGKFFDLLYASWKGLAQQFGPLLMSLSGIQTDFSFALLPEEKTISKHIKRSAYLYAVPHADGVLFDGEADLLPLSWWVAQSQILFDLGMEMANCSEPGKEIQIPASRRSESDEEERRDTIVE